jgi:hypothetical protein
MKHVFCIAFALAACVGTPSPISLSTDADAADTSRPDDTADADLTSDTHDDASPLDTDTSETIDTSAPVTCSPFDPSSVTLVIPEGDEVLPQTVIQPWVTGPGTACVAGYRWSVDQPVGSTSTFRPTPYVTSPLFEANIIGVYTFGVELTGPEGQRLVTLTKEVVAAPGAALRVELIWNTPTASDSSDTGPTGGNLDLHFAHELAQSSYDGDGDGRADPWFDKVYDTFWYNKQPNWGYLAPGVDDDPSLDRDDPVGDGPENVNLALAESGVTYHVGVHYWAANGLGPSFATVRIYSYGVLIFEQADVELHEHDLWWVTDLTWNLSPSAAPTASRTCAGTIDPCTTDAECTTTCALRITPNYVPPFFAPY